MKVKLILLIPNYMRGKKRTAGAALKDFDDVKDLSLYAKLDFKV